MKFTLTTAVIAVCASAQWEAVLDSLENVMESYWQHEKLQLD
jgi:hypothetical protein